MSLLENAPGAADEIATAPNDPGAGTPPDVSPAKALELPKASLSTNVTETGVDELGVHGVTDAQYKVPAFAIGGVNKNIATTVQRIEAPGPT